MFQRIARCVIAAITDSYNESMSMFGDNRLQLLKRICGQAHGRVLHWKSLVQNGLGVSMRIRVDVDRLRGYMLNEYGTAAFNELPAAVMVAWEIEGMSGEELCREVERRGIDLRDFQI